MRYSEIIVTLVALPVVSTFQTPSNVNTFLSANNNNNIYKFNNNNNNNYNNNCRLATSVQKTQESLSAKDSTLYDDNDDNDNEEAFKRLTKQLCVERNLPLEKVKNGRDLASVQNSPIQPGRVFRMGRLGDATANDQELLLNQLNVRTLVDLRSPTELKDDPALMTPIFKDFIDILWIESKKCTKELKPGQLPIKPRRKKNNKNKTINNNNNDSSDIEITEKDTVIVVQEKQHDNTTKEVVVGVTEGSDELCENDCGDKSSTPAMYDANGKHRKERHFVSLMNEFKYVRGTVSRIRKRDLATSILKSPGAVVSKRVWNSLKKPFIEEINDGGLPMLNELLLQFGAPGIKYVLELCADKSRHPVVFYCTAGKDRTGMIAAIILALLGVKSQDIVQDYTLSANVYAEMNDHQAMVGALSQRSLDPKTFLGAPPHVMYDTLVAIEENYGSVEGYCNWIGFGPDQQEKLKNALLE